MKAGTDNVGQTRNETKIEWTPPIVLTFAAILLLALIARVVISIVITNVAAPDEWSQTREPAHLLAYGNGLLSWEWVEGVRSWVFPAFLAAIMRATDWMGAGSAGYRLGIAIVLSLLSLTTVWFSFMWGFRTSGAVAAIIAAGAAATWFELVYYAPKAMYEVVSAHILLPGLYLGAFGDSIGGRKRLFLAGVLLGLAVALRPPLALAAVLAAAAFSLGGWRAKVPAIAAGLLVPIVFFGIIDAFTWSYPFESFIRLFLVNAAEGQIKPWYWYAPTLALRFGPLVLLALAGVRRAPLLGWIALAIVATHSLFGNKEFRYAYPVVPMVVTLAGLGAVEILSILRPRVPLLRRPIVACAAGLAPCICISGILAAFFPLWSRFSGNLIALDALSRDRGVCGVALVSQRQNPVFSGGYTYLHRDVPIFFFRQPEEAVRKDLTASFNAVVTSVPMPYPGFRQESCWNGTCLYRRPGACAPSPGGEVRFLPPEYNPPPGWKRRL